MQVLVLPISGGAFVNQLAILQHLCCVHFIPDITLSSSGGNVAAYVAAAADWKWPAIERIARKLTPKLFLSPWSTITPIAQTIGFFQCNLYNKGSGVYDFLSHYFTKETITKYEIWTGTFNKTKQRAQLFCNRSQEDSILDCNCIDRELIKGMDPIFAAGDIEIIARAGVASASIPGLVPAQIINDDLCVDGGVAGASPLNIMQEPILKYVKDKGKGLHIFYVNFIDLSASEEQQCKNVIDTWKGAAKNIIHYQNVIDRLSGYSLIRCQQGKMNKAEFICNYENLKRIRNIQQKVKYTLIEIYPKGKYEVDMINFKEEDVIRGIHQTYKNVACRFWWISPDQDNAEIIDTLDKCQIK